MTTMPRVAFLLLFLLILVCVGECARQGGGIGRNGNDRSRPVFSSSDPLIGRNAHRPSHGMRSEALRSTLTADVDGQLKLARSDAYAARKRQQMSEAASLEKERHTEQTFTAKGGAGDYDYGMDAAPRRELMTAMASNAIGSKTLYGLCDDVFQTGDYSWTCCDYYDTWYGYSADELVQCYALVRFMCSFHEINGSSWTKHDGWYSSSDPYYLPQTVPEMQAYCPLHYCDWYGISCHNVSIYPSLNHTVRDINLHNNGLVGRLVPSRFWELEKLETVNLGVYELDDWVNRVVQYLWFESNSNVVIEIQPGLSNLSWLENILLDNTGSPPLPKSDQNYPWLRILSMYGCGIHELTEPYDNDFFLKAPEFVFASFRYNQLTRFPSKLNELVSLDLTGNRISDFSILSGSALKCLLLSENQLIVVPNLIAVSGTLTTVDLHNNQIFEFAAGFDPADYTKMKRFLLSGNVLEELPSNIGSMGSSWGLESFSFYSNRLKSLPSTLRDLGDWYISDEFVVDNMGSYGYTWSEAAKVETTFARTLCLQDNILSELQWQLALLFTSGGFDSVWLDQNLLSAFPYAFFQEASSVIWEFRACRNNLSSMGLLSDSGLRSLILDDNVIDSIPDQFFASLPSLTSVSLRGNELTVLPSSISSLVNLTLLDVSNNFVSSLPSDFGLKCAERLCTLVASRNNISYIPYTVGSLRNLAVLDLSYNEIESLPFSFSDIGSYPPDVNSECYYSIPLDLLDHESMKSYQYPCENPMIDACLGGRLAIDLSNNKLSELPQDLDTMGVRLLYLDLGNNRLSSFPKLTYSNWTELMLYLDHNEFVGALPDDTLCTGDYCVVLRELDLSWNNFTELAWAAAPSSQGGDLVFLDVSHNLLTGDGLSGFWFSSIDGGKCILLLFRASWNSLEYLPTSLKRCYLLQVIDVSHNDFRRIPEAFMTQDRWLIGGHSGYSEIMSMDLSYNMISAVPSEIFESAAELDNVLTEAELKLSMMPNQFLMIETGVEHFDISHNLIAGPLVVSSSARTFRISDNDLTLLLINNDYLADLDVSGNPRLSLFPRLYSKYMYDVLTPFYGVEQRWTELTAGLRTLRLRRTGIVESLDYLCEQRAFSRLNVLEVSGSQGIFGGIPDCFVELPLFIVEAENMSASFRDISTGKTAKLSSRAALFAKSVRASASTVTEVSRATFEKRIVGGVGISAGVLKYDPLSLTGFPLEHFSCAKVVLDESALAMAQSDEVNDVTVGVEPDYYEFQGCRCDEFYHGDPSVGVACVSCEFPASCPVPGLVYPIPSPGYWAAANPPFSALRCRPIDSSGKTACSNTHETHAESKVAYYRRIFEIANYENPTVNYASNIHMPCDEGYDDVICSKCEEGYYAVGFKCNKCPSSHWAFKVVQAILSSLMVTGMFFALVFFGYKDTSKWKSRREEERSLVGKRQHLKKKRIEIRRRLSSVSTPSSQSVVSEDQVVEGVFAPVDPRVTLDAASMRKMLSALSEDTEFEARSEERLIFGVSTLIFHFQMFNLMTKVGTGMFDTDSVSGEGISFVNFQLGTPECYFGPGYDFFTSFLVSMVTPGLQMFGVLLLFPISFSLYQIVFFVSSLVRFVVACIAGKDEIRRRALAQLLARILLWRDWLMRHVYIILFIWFSTYMNVTPRVFQGLSCEKFSHGDSSQSFWFMGSAPYIECSFSNPKWVMIFFLSWIMLVTWVVGLPLLLLFLTMFELRAGSFMFRLYRRHPGSRKDQLVENFLWIVPSFLKPYLGQYAMLKAHKMAHVRKYWEVGKMLLKVGVSMVVGLIPFDSAFVPFLLILLFAGAASMQVLGSPYIRKYPALLKLGDGSHKGKNTYANELELVSFVLIVMNFCVAMISRIPETTGIRGVSIFTLILNILFFFAALVVIFRSPVFVYPFVSPILKLVVICKLIWGKVKSGEGERGEGDHENVEMDVCESESTGSGEELIEGSSVSESEQAEGIHSADNSEIDTQSSNQGDPEDHGDVFVITVGVAEGASQ